MSFADLLDYSLATAQAVLAILLWHRAEPRMREARGRWQASCIILLGFVLAWGVILALSRPIYDSPLNWQRTIRDLCLVVYATCLYHRAMKVGKYPEMA